MTTTIHQKPIRAGIFTSVERADEAIRRLLDAGFTQEEITVICSDEARQRHFDAYRDEEAVKEKGETEPFRSGLIGAALGGMVSLVGVMTTGGLSIVALGPLVGGGVTGTLVGLLVGRGVEDELARFYDQAVTKGNLLVAVDVPDADDHADRLALASRCLKESGVEPFALEEG